jgi:hypothetical protein
MSVISFAPSKGNGVFAANATALKSWASLLFTAILIPLVKLFIG